MKMKSHYHFDYCPVHDHNPDLVGTEALCIVVMRDNAQDDYPCEWYELCYMCGVDISETFEYELIDGNPHQNDWMCSDCYVAAMFNDPRDVGPEFFRTPHWTWGSC